MKILLALLLLLSGCASVDYWTHTGANPVEVKFVVRNDFPCAQKLLGCWNAVGQTIELKRGMSIDEEACVYRHELAHANGWEHRGGDHFTLDCGPGGLK